MKVTVGNKVVLNEGLHYQEVLKHYINNVPKKFEGEFVEANVELAKEIINGKINYKKWAKVVTGVAVCMGALIGLIDPSSAFAYSGYVDVSPLDRFFSEIYWSLFKVLGYLSLPVWGWVGITLATGGASVEKRTTAKKIGTSLVVGTGFVVGAPWLSQTLVHLWEHIFHVA